jgi:hypothetical protein
MPYLKNTQWSILTYTISNRVKYFRITYYYHTFSTLHLIIHCGSLTLISKPNLHLQGQFQPKKFEYLSWGNQYWPLPPPPLTDLGLKKVHQKKLKILKSHTHTNSDSTTIILTGSYFHIQWCVLHTSIVFHTPHHHAGVTHISL